MRRREPVDMVPMLSRGKHRSPRGGACFMEFASFLAGERWSDHPECTHPLLAGLARAVNDLTSDDGRQRLLGLIPSVIGLTGDDPRVDAAIAIRCAATALPDAAEPRQRALAVGLIATERLLRELNTKGSTPRDLTDLAEHSWSALEMVPEAARWAVDFTSDTRLDARTLKRQSAPCIVRVSVVGIAEACIPDPDDRLHDLLATVIDDCARWLGAGQLVDTAEASSALFRAAALFQ
ncbi:MAG TPA: hypothetical protein VHM29_04625 [Acidimicrobiia bacterium]|nr:hypothetical protein [Acidimicrobiia bacterium]